MKPIIFSTEMVKAILAGKKTQTRRVIKDIDRWDKGCLDGSRINKPLGEVEFYYYDSCYKRNSTKIEPPYGRAGDQLWVRESWASDPTLNKVSPRFLDSAMIYYRTDNDSHYMWRPAIFMPRWASRLTLKITNVRVQRVQDISPYDAEAEGIEVSHYNCDEGQAPDFIPMHRCDPVSKFRELWDRINGPRGYGWEANPWVWVITFHCG